MKKILSILAVGALTFMVAGCGDDNNNDNQTANDNTANEQQSNNTSNSDQGTANDTNAQENETPFNEFSLEVKYPNNQEYEAEYDYENNRIDASIEDDVNNTRVKGEDAEKQLRDKLKSLNIDAQTSEKDVISSVISAFDVADNYQAIDVDITFADGTEKEYRSTK